MLSFEETISIYEILSLKREGKVVKLSEEKLNYQKILDMTTMGMALFSSDHRLLFANDNFTDIIEIPREQLIHTHWEDLFHFSEEQESLLSKDSVLLRDTLLCKHPNGEYSSLFASIKKVDIPHETHKGFFVELFNYDLPMTTHEQSINKLAKVGKVVSQISHDISNPLAIMRIHCDSFSLLAEQNESVSSEEVQKRVSKITVATDRLTNTTKDLKYFAKQLLDGNDKIIEELWQKTLPQDEPHRDD